MMGKPLRLSHCDCTLTYVAVKP